MIIIGAPLYNYAKYKHRLVYRHSCGSYVIFCACYPVTYFIISLNEQWGKTPLLRAAVNGHAEVARFLLDSGSDVHEQDNVSIWWSNRVPLCEIVYSDLQRGWQMGSLFSSDMGIAVLQVATQSQDFTCTCIKPKGLRQPNVHIYN